MRAGDFKPHVGATVRVTWWDAFSIDPWTPLEVLGGEMEPCECQTYGFLTGVKNDHIAVSSTLNVNADVCGTIVIPIGMVKGFDILDGKAVQNEAERLAGPGCTGGSDPAGSAG
jgi:hypothetical protein